MGYSDNWINILNEITKFQKNKNYTWFRGQSNANLKLNSGIYREELKNDTSYLATEKTYYNIFKRMGHIHHNDEDWNLLFTMQHHGVMTRLLDWTESFAVALFFAYDNWNSEENDSAIWLLNPLGLNELTLDEQKFYIPDKSYESYIEKESEFYPNTLALYPIRNSSRIISQQGMFTLQGTKNQPLEEEFEGELIDKNILKKVTFNHTVKRDMEMYLKQNGISDFSLFPSLDGLAKYVNKLGYFRERTSIEV